MEKRNIIGAIPNFPFLEESIDGLSYYQLLAGLNKYIDECVELINNSDIEEWKDAINNVTRLVTELTQKVNSYSTDIDNLKNIVGDTPLLTEAKNCCESINELFNRINNINIEGLERKVGNDTLITEAKNLSGAINELFNTIDPIINLIGSGTLDTTAQNIIGAINEIKVIATSGATTTPISSETNIVSVGVKAVDIVQLNPNGIDGNGHDNLGNETIAKKIKNLNEKDFNNEQLIKFNEIFDINNQYDINRYVINDNAMYKCIKANPVGTPISDNEYFHKTSITDTFKLISDKLSKLFFKLVDTLPWGKSKTFNLENYGLYFLISQTPSDIKFDVIKVVNPNTTLIRNLLPLENIETTADSLAVTVSSSLYFSAVLYKIN